MLAIVNPRAGGGVSERRVEAALGRLRAGGLEFEVARTEAPGHGTELVRRAYADGCRAFIAVGGDGTAHEIVNGLLPGEERATLGFLPVGTGNSFLRDFSARVLEHAVECLTAGRARPCDVLRLEHREGVVHSLNLICLGFPADVATVTNRRFKAFGTAGYVLGVLACLPRLPRRVFPMRVDGGRELERTRCLFHTFSNSKYTGGRMMIAPQAETADGLIEHVCMGPIGRLALVRNFPRLIDGSYLEHPQAARRALRRIDFELEGPTDVMIDGEVRSLHCKSLEILPHTLDVLA